MEINFWRFSKTSFLEIYRYRSGFGGQLIVANIAASGTKGGTRGLEAVVMSRPQTASSEFEFDPSPSPYRISDGLNVTVEGPREAVVKAV